MTSFNGNTLTYNGHKVTFMSAIDSVLEMTDGCLVLLKWGPDKPKRNVFFVEVSGSIRWCIQSYNDLPENEAWPYGGLHLMNGSVRVYNTAGMDCLLDLDNGTISDCKFTK